MELTGISLYTFLLAWTGVESIRLWMERQRILAMPNERSSHTRPTPSGGGLAILLTTLLGLLTIALFQGMLSQTVWSYCIGGLLLGAISWIDDLYTLSSRTRLLIHAVVALATIATVGYWQSITLPLVGTYALGWAGLLLSFIWIVGLTNAYNFMDGIDGIAGSQAVIAGLGWALIGFWSEQTLIMTLGIILAASNFGFLLHNWSPARIFMGDVGSAFLGYSFALLTVIAAQRDPRFIIIGALMLWPFIFDTTFTLIRRWKAGENILSAHRSHLYQRLVIAGYSHRTVTLIYSTLTLISVGSALAWLQRLPGSGAIILLLTPLLPLMLYWFVRSQEGQGKKINTLLSPSTSQSLPQ